MKVLLFLLLALIPLVLATEEPLVRVAHYEPVLDFVVNPERDHLTFKAYGETWGFSIWVSDVTPDENLHDDHFHGTKDGVTNSLASFTLLPDYITGMIIMGNETYWLEAKDPSAPLTLFIYKSSDVWFHPSVSRLNCAHAGHAIAHDDAPRLETRSTHGCTVFTDQFWRSAAHNPSWSAWSATLGLLNDVNAVYSSAGLGAWSFTNGGKRDNKWSTQNALNNMLNDFSAFAANKLGSGFETASWLVGLNIGGLAWVGTACKRAGPSYRTGVMGLANWSRLWTVKTISHELGHNRGAQHDFVKQCAAGQSSGCQCSVMSYCFPSAQTAGGAVNYFSSTSKSQIKATCN